MNCTRFDNPDQSSVLPDSHFPLLSLKKVLLLVLISGLTWFQPGTLLAQHALQSPEAFLGYALGTRFTRHDQVVRYTEYLAAQQPSRCKLLPYGTTYEGRPLLVTVIGSEANIARLEEIRTDNLKSIGLLEGKPSGKQQPSIIWLSYNVHGNEAVSTETYLQVAYDLLNTQNAQTQAWLANSVLILDPCINPDGRERYVQYYGQAVGEKANATSFAREHVEPWPGGRPNHYLFDLNRDWAWQTQKESQARIALYHQWMPHLHADFHEMGVNAPYYFAPSAKPYHEDITPWQRQFQDIIGESNRKYFDANHWLYFTREQYDLFAPTYGDTWPTFNGAIAMTYEQGGSGRAGLAIAKEDGDTLTLVQRIAHHHAASMASIEAVSTRSEQVTKEFQKYFEKARNNPGGVYKTFVFKTKGAEGRIKGLTDYLDRQLIRYSYVKNAKSTQGYQYDTGKNESVKLETDDLLISAYQPKSTLIKVLFEPNTALEDSITYDITSWALPYSFGLKAYALKEKVEGESKPKVAASPVTGNEAALPYAYLARWTGLEDIKFLTAIFQAGVKVRFSELAFEMEGQTYQPGTLIITRTGNEALGKELDKIVAEQAKRIDVAVTPVKSGFVSKGADFGSRSVRAIQKQHVAVLAGEGISSSAFGEVWHYFEQQINYPLTVIGSDYLNTVPLKDIDVLILPAGTYGRVLNDRLLTQIKEWVKAGGKLIAMETAAEYLANKPDFGLKRKAADSTETTKNPYALLKKYGDQERTAISEEVQGSIYRVSLDNTHPLAFGYSETYYALMRSPQAFSFLKEGYNVGVLKKNAYVSGFAGIAARKKLVDSVIYGVQDLGSGQIIYMADNPLFRAFWHNGKLLFGNALFFVGR